MKLSSLIIAGALAATAASQQIKILLLGDSITEISCWRPLVWNQLVSAGLSSRVDFVGSMNNLQSKCSRPSGFDPDHEGHSGWQAYDIARNNIVGWVQSTKPDIVQFMLGTNDAILGGRDVNTILSAYTTILNAIRSANPTAKVIVDKLIPTTLSDATIEALNSAIPGWAQQHTTSQSPIVVADCSRANGFTNAMLEDGVHPNAQGDQFIAQQIGPKLVQFVRDIVGSGGGSSTTTATTTATRTTLTTSTAPSTSTSGPPGGSCAGMWAQCGGNGWAGPKCCSQGTCKFSNDWYSQCV